MHAQVVAHKMSTYLSLSATFIYHVIQSVMAFSQVIVANSKANLEVYPTTWPIISLEEELPWRSGRWIWDKLQSRLVGRPYGWTRMKPYFRNQNIRLIHCHMGPNGLWALPFKHMLGCAVVTSFYGGDFTRLIREERWQRLYGQLFEAGDMFLVEGSTMCDHLIKHGCPQDKVRLHRIGIDLESLPFKPRRLDAGGKIHLLMVARFVEKKGIPYALEAVNRLKMDYPKLQLSILGDGELRPQIEQLIEDLDLKSHVKLLGYQPMQRYWAQLGQAHVLIAPSVTAADGDTEGGAPTVLLEAQACGLPVVSTCHADIPEVVLDGKSGLLVEERDALGLAEAISDLIEHPETWASMGQAGRRHVEMNHDSKLLGKRLEELYKELIGA